MDIFFFSTPQDYRYDRWHHGSGGICRVVGDRCYKRREARKEEAWGRRELGWRVGRGRGDVVEDTDTRGTSGMRETEQQGPPTEETAHLQWGNGMETTQFIPQAQLRRRSEAATELNLYNNTDINSCSPRKKVFNTKTYGAFPNDCWLRPDRKNHEDWMWIVMPLGMQ